MARNPSTPRRQRGVALAVALILLTVMALIAIAALRGTMLEARMAAGQADRSFEFQAAESALRVAGGLIAADSTNSLGRDCKGTGKTGCGLPDDSGSVPDCADCWTSAAGTTVSEKVVGTPQYLIQRFDSLSTAEAYGLGNSAATTNAGGGMSTFTSRGYYRVFARSHDPQAGTDRAFVMLTATYAICLPGEANCGNL